jgi:hypothetical protein
VGSFDVFLCHNTVDKPAVRQIAQMLVKEGIKPWLDEDQIRPGTTWQTALGEQIRSTTSSAVFVDNGGVGSSQPIERFIWGTTGRKPAELANVSGSNKTPTMQEAASRLVAGGSEEVESDNVISGARLRRFPSR